MVGNVELCEVGMTLTVDIPCGHGVMALRHGTVGDGHSVSEDFHTLSMAQGSDIGKPYRGRIGVRYLTLGELACLRKAGAC